MYDNTIFLGRIALEPEEPQVVVNRKSLEMYDKRRLLDAISDPDVTRYEIRDLVRRLDGQPPSFWMVILKEIIKVYRLDVLKVFLSVDFTEGLSQEVQELLLAIRYKLPEVALFDPIPLSFEQIVNYLESHGVRSSMLKFALQVGGPKVFLKFRQIFLDQNNL